MCIVQCNGYAIDWQHIIDLYKKNTGAETSTPGLSLVPKLKYEHVYLTSYSKMRVDLAVQVSIFDVHLNVCMTLYKCLHRCLVIQFQKH